MAERASASGDFSVDYYRMFLPPPPFSLLLLFLFVFVFWVFRYAAALFSSFASRESRPRYISRAAAPQGLAEWIDKKCVNLTRLLPSERDWPLTGFLWQRLEMGYCTILYPIVSFSGNLAQPCVCIRSPLFSCIYESKVVQQSPQFTLRKCFDTLYEARYSPEQRGTRRFAQGLGSPYEGVSRSRKAMIVSNLGERVQPNDISIT